MQRGRGAIITMSDAVVSMLTEADIPVGAVVRLSLEAVIAVAVEFPYS